MSQTASFAEEKEQLSGQTEISGNGSFAGQREIIFDGHNEKTHQGEGLIWPRKFTNGDPYQNICWEKRVAKISKSDGFIVFEQKDVEVPSFWSQTATDVVASKYFRGKMNSPERE